MDYKQDFKDGLVERWMDSDIPMIAFLTSNPDNDIPLVTFQNWVKSYIKISAEKITELRQANNDLQKIIEELTSTAGELAPLPMYKILTDNLIFNNIDLQNHFSCVSAADDVKEVKALKAEIENLKSENYYNAVAEFKNQVEVLKNDNNKLKAEIEHLKAENKTDCEPIIDNSYTGQIAKLTAENAQLKVDVSNLNYLLDEKEDAQFEQPVVTLATLQDYCQAVVDAEKALRRFMEGGN